MAKVKFLFQAATSEFHADALRKILIQKDLVRFVASVAFVTEGGVEAIVKELKPVAKISHFFVGIRNEMTSVQALRRLLKLGVKVIAVDTGSRSPIFHPKVFMALGKRESSVIIGSANMTHTGLHNNIEAGAIHTLDMRSSDDKAFLDSISKAFKELQARFPKHVFQLKTISAVESLLHAGRLKDEDVVVAPTVNSSVNRGSRDKLPLMKLFHHSFPKTARRKIKRRIPGAAERTPETPLLATKTKRTPGFVLIWQSRELKERDLNIPSGKTTNATGSMLWKKGATEDIDQRHFFRDRAFLGLDWQRDQALPHYERAKANFQIVIKGLDYGNVKLDLSHNTRTDTKSYRQKNSMTSVHWGSALSFIAKRDLLGRVMSLYRKEGHPPEFLLEID